MVTSYVTDLSGPGQHPPLPPCPHHCRECCPTSDCQHLHLRGLQRLLCSLPQQPRSDREFRLLGSSLNQHWLKLVENTQLSHPWSGIILRHEYTCSPSFPSRVRLWLSMVATCLLMTIPLAACPPHLLFHFSTVFSWDPFLKRSLVLGSLPQGLF